MLMQMQMLMLILMLTVPHICVHQFRCNRHHCQLSPHRHPLGPHTGPHPVLQFLFLFTKLQFLVLIQVIITIYMGQVLIFLFLIFLILVLAIPNLPFSCIQCLQKNVIQRLLLVQVILVLILARTCLSYFVS